MVPLSVECKHPGRPRRGPNCAGGIYRDRPGPGLGPRFGHVVGRRPASIDPDQRVGPRRHPGGPVRTNRQVADDREVGEHAIVDDRPDPVEVGQPPITRRPHRPVRCHCHVRNATTAQPIRLREDRGRRRLEIPPHRTDLRGGPQRPIGGPCQIEDFVGGADVDTGHRDADCRRRDGRGIGDRRNRWRVGHQQPGSEQGGTADEEHDHRGG